MEDRLIDVKNSIINKVLLYAALFSSFPYVISLIKVFSFEWHPVFLAYSAFYALLISITFLRKRLSFSSKTHVFGIVYTLIGLLCIDVYGIGAGFPYCIAGVVVVGMVLGKRLASIYFLSCMLFAVGIAVLHLGGVQKFIVPSPSFEYDMISWATMITSFVCNCFFILAAIYEFKSYFVTSIRETEDNVRALSQNEEMFKTLFEKSTDGITLLTKSGFIDFNETIIKLLGYNSKKELLGKQPWDLSPEYQPDGSNSREKAAEIISKCNDQGFYRFEWLHKKKNGLNVYFEIMLTPVIYNFQEIIYCIWRDIDDKKRAELELENYRSNLELLVKQRTDLLEDTNRELLATNVKLNDNSELIRLQNAELKKTLKDLKETQAQLLQSEKMASLGVLTAGVAHEINNPLNFIMGGCTGLERYLQEHHFLDEHVNVFIDGIKSGVTRADSIVKSLGQFSRSIDSFDEQCDLHRILDNCLVMLQHEFRKRIEVIKDYASQDLIVSGNSGKLHQVFINVFSNSIQAIADRGTINVLTYLDENQAFISITDDGEGISSKNISRITDPFFTTKEPGKGTGLGLSIVYSIVNQHGGTIEFKSNEKKGTEVIVRLPLEKEELQYK